MNIDEILAKALEITSDSDRDAYIQNACAGNRELEDQVRRLLRAHDKAGDFLEQPALEQAPTTDFSREFKDALLGTMIGPYKLKEQIGEGGFGLVFVAEQQEPVRRRVALKVIKPGMDSREVIARFEAERQALAMMDHPNIAKVFDGGMTEQGRPYFVMEYVKGVPFTTYCDGARLSLNDRLNLFIPVCQAVQHAHHKGVVHRDLKPANILICLYDGKPVPKVIDFGLAKALHQQLTKHSLYTGHGVMVGTPLYMSPEQAEHNNLDIDARTDIYSLGVVLCELLTGTTPLEREQLKTAAYNEILRLIKEVEPPKPSTRLSGTASLPSIAAQRNIDPRHLQRSLAGDLDWIVMRALEKERSRRYETATALARDIERFLNDEAVEACPPSTIYRLKKFARKHKLQTIAATAVLLSLIIGILSATWGLFRARTAEHAAARSEARAIHALGEVTQERDAKVAEQRKTAAALVAEAEQREKAEVQLCEGILRPIGFDDDPNLAELRAFVDWSALPDNRLKLKVLEVAFADPATALRVARRSDRAMQACIGLSTARRAQALELLAIKQRDMTADPKTRVAACWLTMELGSVDLPALEESIGFQGAPFFDRTPTLFKSSQLDPQQVTRAWTVFVEVLGDSTRWDVLFLVGEAMAPLVPRLEPQQVTPAWDGLIGVLETTDDYAAIYAAGEALSALAPRLEPHQITRAWDVLVDVRGKSQHSVVRHSDSTLASLARRLEPQEVTRAGDGLIEVLLAKTTDYAAILTSSKAITALAPRLEPQQITQAWDALVAVLGKPTDEEVLGVVGRALVALAQQLDPQQVTRAWEALVEVLGDPTKDDIVHPVGDALATLASRLEPQQVTRAWDVLVGVMGTSTDWAVIDSVGEVLAALAPRLAPQQVTRAGDELIDVLGKTLDGFVRYAAGGKALAALAPRLEQQQVSRAGDALVDRLGTEDDSSLVLDGVGTAFAALAPRLEPQQVSRAGDALVERLGTMEISYDRAATGKALVALAPRLEPQQIASAGDALVDMLRKTTDVSIGSSAGEAMAALAPWLDPQQVARAGDAIIEWAGNQITITIEHVGTGAIAILTNPKKIAWLLTHPGCAGDERDYLLQRFEELVLHNGQHVFLKPEATADSAESAQTAPAESTPATPPRQFHTIYDAAAWIETNWPDFDLDATHPVTWRGVED